MLWKLKTTKATRMTRRMRSVKENVEVEVRTSSITSRRRGSTCQRNPPGGNSIDMKNLLKKNQDSMAKLQQHDADIRKLNRHDREAAALKNGMRRLEEEQKKVTSDRDRLKQLLDDQKWRSMDIKSKFDRDMMNLLKKNEQHEAALGEFKEKHGK
nr:unnamed protein product [Callosobruchus chinensis]